MTRITDRRIVGVDLSMTATGICDMANGARTVTSRPGTDDLGRLRGIVDRVAAECAGAELVVLEGLAFASRTGKASERAGLHWLLRDRLDRQGLALAIVTPTARAKYATGKGNAGKDQVLIAVVQRFPIQVSDNNEADAAVLMAMGLDHVGEPIAVVPQTHRAALAGVVWPVLAEAVAS